MSNRKRFRKRPKFHVHAVQIDLEFSEFKYQKWGGEQTARPGDWLVDNNGDVYTVKKDYFRDYYKKISPGVYEKVGEIWAEAAAEKGTIETLEGTTDYNSGDYLVFDRRQGGDGYAVKKQVFERMYEPIDEEMELNTGQKAYIEERIIPIILKYRSNAQKNRRQYHLWQTITIIAAALVPVLSGSVNDLQDLFKWTVAFLGATSAVIAGFCVIMENF